MRFPLNHNRPGGCGTLLAIITFHPPIAIQPRLLKTRQPLARRSGQTEIDAFLRKARALSPASGRGRLIFALDATASREPTWDLACRIQGEMFTETSALGGLNVQLCHYRGFHEFHASGWVSDSRELLQEMTRTTCAGGLTQIARVLRHALEPTKRQRVDALVFVGDCVEEDIDLLADLAGQLGLLRLPVFLFQEGADPVASRAFREIARLSGGAHCHFDLHSSRVLRDLLAAVAVFASGGRGALDRFVEHRGGDLRLLAHQLRDR